MAESLLVCILFCIKIYQIRDFSKSTNKNYVRSFYNPIKICYFIFLYFKPIEIVETSFGPIKSSNLLFYHFFEI